MSLLRSDRGLQVFDASFFDEVDAETRDDLLRYLHLCPMKAQCVDSGLTIEDPVLPPLLVDRIDEEERDGRRVVTFVLYDFEEWTPELGQQATSELAKMACMLRQHGYCDGPDALEGKVVFLGGSGRVELYTFEPGALRDAEERLSETRSEILDERGPGGVMRVVSKADADRVVGVLMGLKDQGRWHAVDTEIVGWDPAVSPYSAGKVACFTVYCGPDVDFGRRDPSGGPQSGVRDRLYVETLDARGEDNGLLEVFREYLEDPGIPKVFHNYSFDRAMFRRMGITVGGFAADTLHMARLWKTDDLTSYALGSLAKNHLPGDWKKQGKFEDLRSKDEEWTDIVADPARRREAIDYATFDAAVTWKLYMFLRGKLSDDEWKDSLKSSGGKTLHDFYHEYWRPLAEALAQVEERGIEVDVRFLEGEAERAESEVKEAEQGFREWLQKFYEEQHPDDHDLPDTARDINLSSRLQLGALIFGSAGDETETGGMRIVCLGVPTKLTEVTKISKQAVVNREVLQKLAGPNPKSGESGCGEALEFLGQAGCVAMADLKRMLDVQKILSTFLEPLQRHADENHRVHSSLNINTVSGRLSSRNPNLQQQPAFERAGYHIRRAFRSGRGKRLIVADYAQLELRVLAHVSGEASMIECLRSDGDLHSRTAYEMYEHVQESVDSGEILIECGGGAKPTIKDRFGEERRNAKTVTFGIIYGLTAMGLSKDLSCSKEKAADVIERWYDSRPAVKRWQEELIAEGAGRSRQGKMPAVHTLRGRRRLLRDLASEVGWKRGAAERQAVNLPAQGGAADIVNEAMVKVNSNPELKTLGYHIVLQVHDELVLEGPEENAERALAVLREAMEDPFLDGSKLNVPLPVDTHIVECWSEAK